MWFQNTIYLKKWSYFLPREFNGLHGAEVYIFSNTFHCVSRPDLNVWGFLSHIITGEQFDFLDYFGSNCNNGYISFDVFSQIVYFYLDILPILWISSWERNSSLSQSSSISISRWQVDISFLLKKLLIWCVKCQGNSSIYIELY